MDPPRQDTSLPAKWPGVWTLLQQLPPQDCDERYCLALGEEELAELRLFCAQRKQKALGQGVARLIPPELEGHACEKCKQQLRPGEVGIFAAPEGEQHCWHWPCFVCQACGQVLVHLICFYHDGHLYCGRHHAELLRPRCPACDQLIFSRRCTEAEGRRWHENHFCCLDCAGPLAEGRYTLPGGSPCCPSCFESRYPDTAGAPEGQAPRGKGAEGADHSGRDRDWGFSRVTVPITVPRRPIPLAAAPTCFHSPHPHLRGPQLSPRDPGLGAALRVPPEPTPCGGRAVARDSLPGGGDAAPGSMEAHGARSETRASAPSPARNRGSRIRPQRRKRPRPGEHRSSSSPRRPGRNPGTRGQRPLPHLLLVLRVRTRGLLPRPAPARAPEDPGARRRLGEALLRLLAARRDPWVPAAGGGQRGDRDNAVGEPWGRQRGGQRQRRAYCDFSWRLRGASLPALLFPAAPCSGANEMITRRG